MEINEYIESFICSKDKIIDKIDKDYSYRTDLIPTIGIQTGIFLCWLIQLTQAKRVIEFGTCIGYSAIILARALKKNGGKLITVENNKSLYNEAKENIKLSNLENVIEQIYGDAHQVLDKQEGLFDLILQDSSKDLYPKMLDKCIEKLKPSGVLAADDSLFVPMGIEEKYSVPMHEYNKKVFSNPQLSSTILPIGDGLTISIKK